MLTYNNKAPIKMKIRVKRYALFFVEITIKFFFGAVIKYCMERADKKMSILGLYSVRSFQGVGGSINLQCNKVL